MSPWTWIIAPHCCLSEQYVAAFTPTHSHEWVTLWLDKSPYKSTKTIPFFVLFLLARKKSLKTMLEMVVDSKPNCPYITAGLWAESRAFARGQMMVVTTKESFFQSDFLLHDFQWEKTHISRAKVQQKNGLTCMTKRLLLELQSDFALHNLILNWIAFLRFWGILGMIIHWDIWIDKLDLASHISYLSDKRWRFFWHVLLDSYNICKLLW